MLFNILSLTSFLTILKVKHQFSKTFPLKSPKLSGKLRAPPQTKHYSLIGTAFDYLLRFHVERLNPDALTSDWVAELAVEVTRPKPEIYEKLTKTIDVIKKGPYADFLKTGKLSETLVASTIILAKLDLILRIGRLDPNILDYQDEDVLDLRNLISIVDDSLFKSKNFCSLNPTFGNASGLVGGADADLIIDDTLIDIKTTKNLKFEREYYNQLIGYYVLSKIGHIDGLNNKIKKVGIYFSRHGIFHSIPVSQIEENPQFNSFVKWFEDEARSVFY